MGGGASTSAAHQRRLGKSQNEIVTMMMPLYYDTVDVTPAQIKLADDCWKLILNDATPEFLARKGTGGFPYQSCVTYFYDTFYTRLFDCHPIARELFRSPMKDQGRALVMMISLALSDISKSAQLDKSLRKLAEIHYHRGVKSVQYAIMGDVLFWTLRRVLGNDHYNGPLHYAWVAVYSRLLRTIVPAAVTLELGETTVDYHGGEVQKMFGVGATLASSDPAEERLISQAMVRHPHGDVSAAGGY